MELTISELNWCWWSSPWRADWGISEKSGMGLLVRLNMVWILLVRVSKMREVKCSGCVINCRLFVDDLREEWRICVGWHVDVVGLAWVPEGVRRSVVKVLLPGCRGW